MNCLWILRSCNILLKRHYTYFYLGNLGQEDHEIVALVLNKSNNVTGFAVVEHSTISALFQGSRKIKNIKWPGLFHGFIQYLKNVMFFTQFIPFWKNLHKKFKDFPLLGGDVYYCACARPTNVRVMGEVA